MRTEDFSQNVINEIARNAMYICSNPRCLRFTGYETTEGKARVIAEAAHVFPSAKSGPRGSTAMPNNYDLKSSKNGIWLCSICHKKIDDDPMHYPMDVLFDWKKNHENILREIVGKDLENALIGLLNHREYNNEARDFISFIESRRVLYEGLDMEFPPRVLESINMIRERINFTRSRINSNTILFNALNEMQNVIIEFLRNIGKDTDLALLRCDSRDPQWVLFSEELIKLRSRIVMTVKFISGNVDYKLSWM